MAEINADVLAQMKRLWSALNDGTVDVVTANDALRQMHDFLTGAAYEGQEVAAPAPDEGGVEEHDVGGEAPAVITHKKASRRKR
jgi:hypothetical protein